MQGQARVRAVSPAFILIAAVSLFLSTEPARSEVVEALKAYDFVDSLGVNTHISRRKGVLDDEGWGIVGNAIADAGFRYVRTTITNGKGIDRVRDMHATHGTRFNLRIDTRALEGTDTIPLRADGIGEMIDLTKQAGVDAILSYEGPNEYNAQQGDNPDWANQLKGFMKRLYEHVKADPEIAGKPVLAPSIWRRTTADYQAMGDLSAWTDKGCLHNYNASRRPSDALDRNIEGAASMTPGQPIWVTEYGYNSAVDSADVWYPITEYSQAKYLPRYAAEFFIRPEVEKAFNYQIIDEWPAEQRPDKAWGLLRNDFSKRPSYLAMKNTIRLLDDGDGDFTPGSLDYDLIGDLTDIHSFLVQKRSGTFYLVLWQEVDSYDRKARVDLHPDPRPLTLVLNTPVAEASTFLPTGLDLADPEEAGLAVDVYADPIAVALDVPDELLVVEIVPALDIEPAGVPDDIAAPNSPEGLAARWGGGRSVALSWNPPADNVGVVGYNVYRNDKLIATTDEPSHRFNGKWRRTYTFSVSAIDAAGNESALSPTVEVTLSSAWVRNQ